MSAISLQILPPETAVARSSRLDALRGLLAEKFPACELKHGGVLSTGLRVFDEAEGGLRRGALTELAGSPGAGALFLEAMLAGLPCIGTTSWAMPEIIVHGETGWLVPDGSVSELATVLLENATKSPLP